MTTKKSKKKKTRVGGNSKKKSVPRKSKKTTTRSKTTTKKATTPPPFVSYITLPQPQITAQVAADLVSKRASASMSKTELQMLARMRGIPWGGLSRTRLVRKINSYML